MRWAPGIELRPLGFYAVIISAHWVILRVFTLTFLRVGLTINLEWLFLCLFWDEWPFCLLGKTVLFWMTLCHLHKSQTMTCIALWPLWNHGFSKRKLHLCNNFLKAVLFWDKWTHNAISRLFFFFSYFFFLFYCRWNETKLLMTSGMGKASGRFAKVLAALCAWAGHLAFISLSSSKHNGNSISRSGREAFRRLWTETWCSLAGGHICAKCLDLFIYQRRNLGIWMTPRLGEVWGVDCAWREVSHVFRPDSLKPGEEVRSQVSLGRRVFHIIKASLSQGTLSFCLGEDEFSKWLN